MRIIRTSIRRRGRAAAAITMIVPTIALLPAAAFLIAKNVPALLDMAGYARITGLFVDNIGVSAVNNGEQLLFSPEADTLPEREERLPEENRLPEEAENNLPEHDTASLMLTENLSEESEDLTAFCVHSGAIREATYSASYGDAFIDLPLGGQIRNCTELSNELVRAESVKPSAISVELWSDEPQVLILHTHTSESYEPYEKDWYDDSYTSRSRDPDNSVVAVGEAIARELAASGINVLHDCTPHDDVYTGAYSRSLSTADAVLARYPSVKVVLDVHRDAIEDADGTRVSAVAEIDGKKAAQVMVISAADDGTYGIPRYPENMHFACELQQAMESSFAGLTRPVLFQYCQYNQQVSTGALLLEVGSHGNSVEQAVYSGELIGKALAELLCSKAEEDLESIAVPCSAPMYVPLYFFDRVR